MPCPSLSCSKTPLSRVRKTEPMSSPQDGHPVQDGSPPQDAPPIQDMTATGAHGDTPARSWWSRVRDVVTGGAIASPQSRDQAGSDGGDISAAIRRHAVRPIRELQAPKGLDYIAYATVGPDGPIALWTKGNTHYVEAGHPAALTAYLGGSEEPTLTLHLAAVPGRFAKIAQLPGGSWALLGTCDPPGAVLCVIGPDGVERARVEFEDSVGDLATDSDGFMWTLGLQIRQWSPDLRQVWATALDDTDMVSPDAFNVSAGQMTAYLTNEDGPGHLQRLLVKRGDDVTMPEAGTEVLDVTGVMVSGDWIGLVVEDEDRWEATVRVGTVQGGQFTERFRVALVNPDGDALSPDDTSTYGESAYFMDLEQMYAVSLSELLRDR